MSCIKLILLSLALGLGSLSAKANPSYYPEGFIQKATSADSISEEIKIELFKIVSFYHYKERGQEHDLIVKKCPKNRNCFIQDSSFSYRQARKYLFGLLHLKQDDLGYYVNDLYCQKTIREDDGVAPGRIPNHMKINCEHTWPQSKFTEAFSKHAQKVDLHHLYPVNSRANSSRANHPFGHVDGGRPVNSSCEKAYVGVDFSGAQYSFEPPHSHRGNVARAMFYFSIRYKSKINPIQEEYLRRWHLEDPVDAEEKRRNDQIEALQKNRNPFIDYPRLVSTIDDF
ncbi:MAG: endonuclease I family protein [Bacteriovoracaceae bacterium]